MMNRRERMIEWHRAVGFPVLTHPEVPPLDRVKLRLSWVMEEALELVAACLSLGASQIKELQEFVLATIQDVRRENVRLVEVANALEGLDNAVEGMRLEAGIEGDSIAWAVHRSSLAKTYECMACDREGMIQGKPCVQCGGAGRRSQKDALGRVVKPIGWKAPDVRACLLQQGWVEDLRGVEPDNEYSITGTLGELDVPEQVADSLRVVTDYVQSGGSQGSRREASWEGVEGEGTPAPSGIVMEIAERLPFNQGVAVESIWQSEHAKGNAVPHLRKAVWHLEREILRRLAKTGTRR